MFSMKAFPVDLSTRNVQRFVFLYYFFIELHVTLSDLVSYPNYRLNNDARPLSYKLIIKPYLYSGDGDKQFTFDGEAFINFTFKYDCDQVVLHSNNLIFSKIEYWESELPNIKMEPVGWKEDPETDKLTLQLEDCMVFGEIYTFHFVYTGSIGNDLTGFYRSSYLDRNNHERWIGVTMFEPFYARKAFPCFDEPKYTSEFQVTIIRRYNFRTVSNTRLQSTVKIDSFFYADTYEKTPRMSTYNLAWLISEFIERSDGNLSVITRPEYFEMTSYSFNLGKKLLEEYGKYFSMPYESLGITKIDLAAIPDMMIGGMENWGLVTFRECFLLFDEKWGTLSDQQNIAVTLSHELAHMWFGNSVVCEWWSYTWLKEGFAKYFEYIMTARIYPDWELEKQFVVNELQLTLASDSNLYQRPISDITVSSPDEVQKAISDITYQKGSSIIRMLHHSMGEKNFQIALQNYLAEFKNKVVSPENILSHFVINWPEATFIFARDVFDSFTMQSGYPLVTVNVSSDGNSMRISQKRFLLTNDDNDTQLFYTVPFTYTTSTEKNFASTEPKLYLRASDHFYRINFSTPVDWVVANIQQTGYYRVNYNKGNWKKICKALKQDNWGGIHVVNRAQIVDDLFNLARSGHINFTLALTCLEYLRTESHFLPWKTAFRNYDFLQKRLGTNNFFSNYILQQINGVYSYLGFDEKPNDSRLDIFNRRDVLYYACKYGNEECISKSLSLFEAMETSPVPVNIRFPVYCTALREGTEKHFDDMFKKYESKNDQEDISLILNVLSCVKNITIVKKYFNIIISTDAIPMEDKTAALMNLFSLNQENTFPVYKMMTKNYEKLAEKLGSYYMVSLLFYQIVNLFSNQDQLDDFENFTENNGLKFEESIFILEEAIKLARNNLIEMSGTFSSVLKYLIYDYLRDES